MNPVTMHVELSDFCQQFSSSLSEPSSALENAISAMRELRDPGGLEAVLSGLADNQHRLKILRDKADQEDAYLLIFGPLKSGKSTLMNAISGSYVSEVTSLPAYPCLVYVQEGADTRYSATSFDGSVTEFDSSDALQERIEEAHRELAGEIREAEKHDRPFNPAEDFPEAIRRIDFTLPAPNLRQSGTILVDTPGLYTRMKYNYDQLTRDFRNNAACAVFVVKTDNLFYDRVFEEFTDLLGVFSRVFLVVNIDSSRQDLDPEGGVRPSLEARDPRKIIEAFENLAVSAQLEEAIEQGQLQIYMVDLLQTASRSLRGEPQSEPPSSEEADSTPGDGAAGANGDRPSLLAEPKIGFDCFLEDLTSYLNSSDYIAEFMTDSLRQANSIMGEVEAQLQSTALEQFRTETRWLSDKAEKARRGLGDVEILLREDFTAPVEEFKTSVSRASQAERDTAARTLKESAKVEIAAWFEDDRGLHDLTSSVLGSAIESEDKRLRAETLDTIAQRSRGPACGVDVGVPTLDRLRDLEVSLDDVYGTCAEAIEKGLDAPTDGAALELDPLSIPVRKTILDWLLFRSQERVRYKVFGNPATPVQTIDPALKHKRLGGEARERLTQAVHEHIDKVIVEGQAADLTRALDGYAETYGETFTRRLEQRKQQLTNEREEYRQRHTEQSKVIDAADSLVIAASSTLESTFELRENFVSQRQPDVEEDSDLKLDFDPALSGSDPEADIDLEFPSQRAITPAAEQPAAQDDAALPPGLAG